MDIGRDGYWKQHVINSSALSAPKISKTVAAQKNKLEIQSKRVLGCIKYTHRLADHNKVTQYDFFVETCLILRTISRHNQKTDTTAQLYCTLSMYVTPKTISHRNQKTNITPQLYCTLST
jgi:hypothetical protein